ncbi:hypothetical protein K6V34_02535, partial [Streptococcus suis]|uniref:hypothetical protein n=1 Tax=Streptococcus suis TaxID=1307 RepID=UPI001B7D82FA
KKIVQDNRDKRKTQTVRLNFIKISLNLSVFFIYWLVFAQPLFVNGFEPVFLVEKNKKTTSYAGGCQGFELPFLFPVII